MVILTPARETARFFVQIRFALTFKLTKPRDTAHRSSPKQAQPAWENRRGEEFSERGPNFLNYVQQIFSRGGEKICRGARLPVYGPAPKCYFLYEIFLPHCLPQFIMKEQLVMTILSLHSYNAT